MASINVDDLLSKMTVAAAASFNTNWPGVKEYAQAELQKIAADMAFIEGQCVAGKMTEDQAKLQLHLQVNASKTILLAGQGMSILAVEAAINAALGVVKETVNAALGFAIL